MRKKQTKAIVIRSNNTKLVLDDPRRFQMALKSEKAKRDLIKKFIKSELKQDVDYGVIKIKSKKTGKEFTSKPTLFKSGSEKFASLLNLTPVFKEDELTTKQLPESIKNQGVFILKCELIQKDKNIVVSEGRGACTISEVSGDINKAVKIV